MLKDLTYKVIVIDDEVDLYEDYTEHIREQLDSEGYILQCERFEELCELDENPISDVDLFLVDLKFGKEDKGPEFIRKIRENYLTDILFYSSDSKAIQKNRTSGEYQGVFFAIRDENKNEIISMIDQLIHKMIKRSNTPLSSRGIVLGCVAEIDNIIKTKIALILGKIPPEQRSAVLDKCAKIYFDSFKGQSKKANEFWGCEYHKGLKEWNEFKTARTDFDLPTLVNNVQLTDSSKNFHVLLKTYKALNGEDETYMAIKGLTELLDDRNIFAHVQEELNGENQYQFKRLNGEEYLILTDEKCRELRTSIKNYCLHISSIYEQ